jgi:hypothetical protein
MGRVEEGNRCLICGERRSGRKRHIQQDRGFIEQICSRRTCAEVKRRLQNAVSMSSKAGSLVIEVHHYHHASRIDEVGFNRTHTSSLELHAESLAQSVGVLPVRSGPPFVEPLTKPCEDVVRQRLDDRAR